MTKEEFEKVFAETAEKSGVAEMARDYQFAENLQRMMIDLRDKLCPAEQQSNSLDKFIHSLLETYPTNKNEVPIEALNDYHQGLICGARKTYNWLLESAIKIDAKIVNDESSGCVVDCAQGCLVLEPHTYPIGQRLKIIIVKEDEQ